MTRRFDIAVLGADVNGLVAAIDLAQRGSSVLVLEEHTEPGGALREIEFAPGFRVAPLAPDVGTLGPEVIRALGSVPEALPTADPAVIALTEGAPLFLRSSVHETAQGLAAFSRQDAQRWPEFCARMHALAGFLGVMYAQPAPRIDASSAGELLSLARLGHTFRKLGTDGMVELLRTLPMTLADLLDDWFESAPLKGVLAALGVEDTCQGPMSGGTAFTFLHRQVGARSGVFSERLRVRGGSGALISALVQRARSLGVVLETGVGVGQAAIRDGRIAGVVLDSGEQVDCAGVISALDPYRSLLELIDVAHLDPHFIHAVRNIRFRGVTTKVLLALDGLPEIPGVREPFAGAAVIAPSVRHVERAYDATKYGVPSEDPFVEIRFPSVSQPDLAPAGQHVCTLHVQYTPYRLRDGNWAQLRDTVADRAVALVEQHWPGFASRIRSRAVLSPEDIQTVFGLREGALSQGEMMLDQLFFMRPVAGFSRYATPIPGYTLCGSGTHPGAGISGQSGLLAARTARPR